MGVRDALGEAVRPARVVGHVAADRARLLAARVGREVQPVGGDRTAEVEVQHARLDPRPPRRRRRPTTMRFIFVVEMTIAPSGGTAPPARPVPEPRATNGTPCRRATRTHACTSAVVDGEAHGDRGSLHRRCVVAVQRTARFGRRAPDRSSESPRGDRRRRRSTPASASSLGGSDAQEDHTRLTRPVRRRRAPRRRVARWSCRRTSRPSRSARSSRSRGGPPIVPRATASATRLPERRTPCTAPLRDVGRRQPPRRRRHLAPGVSGAGSTRRRRLRRTSTTRRIMRPAAAAGRPVTCRSPARPP